MCNPWGMDGIGPCLNNVTNTLTKHIVPTVSGNQINWLPGIRVAGFWVGAKKCVWIKYRATVCKIKDWLWVRCSSFAIPLWWRVFVGHCAFDSVCQTLNASKWVSTKSALGPDHSPSFHLTSDSTPPRERQSNFTAGWHPLNLSDEKASPRATVCTWMCCKKTHYSKCTHGKHWRSKLRTQSWLYWQAHQEASTCHFSFVSHSSIAGKYTRAAMLNCMLQCTFKIIVTLCAAPYPPPLHYHPENKTPPVAILAAIRCFLS